MGAFLAVSAFRGVSADDVADEITAWFESHFVVCTDTPRAADLDPGVTVQVFAPHEGWTSVLWPVYFNIHDIAAAEHLSRSMDAVACTVGVYDSDAWQQVVFEAGRPVDRFATDPASLAADSEPLRDVAHRWRGDPSAVAAVLGANEKEIARHYRRNRGARNYDDWAFVDLWTVLGITYPVGEVAVAHTLTLSKGWNKLVPMS